MWKKTTIEISSDGYWVIDGEKTEHRATVEDDNPQCLDFYPLDDDTYGVGVGSAQYLSEIVVPSTYKGKAVTKIVRDAFYDCTSLTSITIPSSVTSIDSSVFSGCTSLTIYCEAESKPSGWSESWKYTDCPVVWDCENNDVADNGYIYTVIDGIRYSLKDGVAVVAKQPRNITTANIPSSVTYKGNTYAVTSIDVYAFSSSPLLTSITIPSSVTSIGSWAFQNCPSLETVTFGENSQLDSIDENTFSYCSSLTSITIPNSVTSIGEYAFASCDSLTSITIPNSVTSIGDSAFRNCSSLTIYCEAKSQPSGWPNNWNEFDWGGNYCPVVWGYEE